MKSRTTRQFRDAFGGMPKDVQGRAREEYRRFLNERGHPVVRFKPVQGVPDVWAAPVGLGYRALATRDGEEVIWFWIGTYSTSHSGKGIRINDVNLGRKLGTRLLSGAGSLG